MKTLATLAVLVAATISFANVAAVPEPVTMFLLGAGLIGISLSARKSRSTI